MKMLQIPGIVAWLKRLLSFYLRTSRGLHARLSCLIEWLPSIHKKKAHMTSTSRLSPLPHFPAPSSCDLLLCAFKIIVVDVDTSKHSYPPKTQNRRARSKNTRKSITTKMASFDHYNALKNLFVLGTTASAIASGSFRIAHRWHLATNTDIQAVSFSPPTCTFPHTSRTAQTNPS